MFTVFRYTGPKTLYKMMEVYLMHAMNNAYALVVGIANYKYYSKLSATVLKDAQDIYNLLVDPHQCGYMSDNVQLLLDSQATKAALRQALADLAQRSHQDSTVFFYISSHGGRIQTGPYIGEYLLPVDTVPTPDRSLAESAISGSEFTEVLQSIQARKVIVVFDCCHAGGIGQLKNANAPVFKAGLPESYYDKLNAGRGCAILASSRGSEYSHVMPGSKNSLFTQHLLNGLRGDIPSEDGLIRIFDLFEYLQPRVTGDQPKQHPFFKAALEENFPVALYLGGQKGIVPRDVEGFRYDAYISYVDRDPDSTWVWDTLVPRLKDAGLRVVVSSEVEKLGVDRVVNIERGIEQSKRTVIVLSEAYIADYWRGVENVLAQQLGINKGTYPLIPVKIEAIDEDHIPLRIRFLCGVNLTHPPRRAEREFNSLVQALQEPLPRR